MRAAAALTVLTMMLPHPAAAQQPSTRQSITIPRVQTPPRFEDYLQAGAPGANGELAGVRVEGFLQRDPGDLVPASERTQAYLSYDAQHLYVVFVCHASDPSRIRARMTRRESILADDVVGVFLDTFNDRQRAYMFLVSPLGIQMDGITTEGQHDDFSFDTIWRTRGQLTDFGYVVMMEIPFKSLRFPASAAAQTWGLALARLIPVNNETSFWPGITNKVNGFAGQFADARGFEGVSPGRNIQLIPYGTFTGARFLDQSAAAFDREVEARAGIDAKVIVRDAVALDFTVNPDFSQVESDEPQVTVNQRFEVFFPEKRPFFLENAGYFETPINLFFSRRIRDPQAGARATGKLGGWAAGLIAIDDRAAGQSLPPADPRFDDRAFNGIARVRREFGDSSVGALLTGREFGSAFNRVASADARLRLSSAWYVGGQAALSDTRTLSGTPLSGSAFAASLSKSGRRVTYNLDYSDIDRDFTSALGFVPRTNIRQATQFLTYRWRPAKGRLISFGPNSFVQRTWDQDGRTEDWLLRFPFEVSFRGQTSVFVRRAEAMERFAGIEFRHHENLINAFSRYFSWIEVGFFASGGTRPNFFPPEGIAPFLADFRDAALFITLRPTSRLLVDQTYIYSRLEARPDSGHTGTIFDNHILRSRVNYQFNRELSLRSIVDYNAVLANPTLVALPRTKHLTGDILLTYLVSPGTAIYVGYTDGYDNVLLDPLTGVRASRSPTTSTGRQVFVKTSYLFRF